MKTRVLVLAAAALILTTMTATAQTGTWTAVGSTGALGPAQVALFAVFNGTRLGFTAGGTSNTLFVRFNVTNTWGGFESDAPPWTILEVGALNTTATDPIVATLYRVNPCTGLRTAICTTTNTLGSSTGACTSCSFPSNTFNFTSFLYYVEVSITRADTNSPQLSTLRIH
jgi:hypothetical protein